MPSSTEYTITVNVIYRSTEIMLAACDSELLGKEFKEGRLRLKVSKSFYGGDSMNTEDFLRNLQNATIANLVGERTIAAAVEAGYIDAECILMVAGTPHAQLFLCEA